MQAGPIDINQARQLAKDFLSQKAMKTKSANGQTAQLSLVKNIAGAYLFNNGTQNGFVIVSGDDNAYQPILGYSDSGTLDASNLSDNMIWWLGQLQQDIEMSAGDATQSNTAVRRSSTASDRTDIEPLLKSQWEQIAPFNDLCPKVMKIKDGDTTYVTAPVGCVATAMAQVMYYHKWPARYDWDNMLDNYSTTAYTEAQGAAVATLLKDLGTSVNMEYGATNSSAHTEDEAYALFNEYGYDRSMKFRYRNNYTAEEWETMIYNELLAGRPISYGGQEPPTGESGHAFVLDGYRNSDGYFHFNWGWAGISDGYFLLTCLNPDRQGTGGGNGLDFSAYQCAVFGIQPMKEGSTSVMEPQLYYTACQMTDNSCEISTSTNLEVCTTISNYDVEPTQVYMGLKLVNTDDEEEVYYIGADEKEGITTSFGLDKALFRYTLKGISSFPTTEGNSKKTYVVIPAYMLLSDNKWHDCYMSSASIFDIHVTKLVATIQGSTVTFATQNFSDDPVVTKIEAPASVEMDKEFTITFTFSSEAIYKGNVALKATTQVEEGITELILTENIASIDTSTGKPVTFTCKMDNELDLIVDEDQETATVNYYLVTNPITNKIKGSEGQLTVKLADTGISAPETTAPSNDAAIYTISGQRTDNATRPGIYIQNGKKHIVK